MLQVLMSKYMVLQALTSTVLFKKYFVISSIIHQTSNIISYSHIYLPVHFPVYLRGDRSFPEEIYFDIVETHLISHMKVFCTQRLEGESLKKK